MKNAIQAKVMPQMQQTLRAPARVSGVGVHSGATMTVDILPAQCGTGIVFHRTDLGPEALIPARATNVTETFFCTKIANDHGDSVSTIEHLMAALAALEIDNAMIQIDGPEMPILDGSAIVFMDHLASIGTAPQTSPRATIVLRETLEIGDGQKWARLTPADDFSITCSIDFYGRQEMAPQTHTFAGPMPTFRQDCAAARTYGFLEDAEKLFAAGLGRGASLDNAVVIDQGAVMNPGGFLFENECARHKVLDALGDLALLGAPLQASYTSHNGGHALNNQLARLLLDRTDSWSFA